jgi:hypothetical protein
VLSQGHVSHLPRTLLLTALFAALLGAQAGPAQAETLPRHPLSAQPPSTPVLRMQGGSLSLEGYKDYLLARFGRSFAEDYAFDACLERATREKGLAPDAPRLAGEHADDTLREYGGQLPAWQLEDRRVRILAEELRRLRAEALVRAEREPSKEDLRALFDETYGVDGQRVKIRHILVSWNGSEQRLRGPDRDKRPNRQQIREHALARARELRKKLDEGRSFYSLLKESDDPITRSLVNNPLRRQYAGLIEDYNYQRYGQEFADAVRALKKGEISAPVLSSHGLHLILLVDREVTRYEDVAEEIERRFQQRPLLFSEVEALRKKLFERYQIQIGL